jgi:branched-chain amino acid transport system permease protein
MASTRGLARCAARNGLIYGAVAVLLSLVGMVEAFSERAIISGLLTLGVLLVLAVYFAAGYATARQLERSGQNATVRLGAGALAGVMAAAVVAGLVLLGTHVNLRPMFIHATSALYDILTFGFSGPAGYLALALVGSAGGLLGAAFRGLPAGIRGAAGIGGLAVLLFGLLGDQLLLILDYHDLGDLARGWLLAPKGVTPLGAVAIFTVTAGLVLLWQRRAGAVKAAFARQPAPRRQRLHQAAWLAALLVTLALPQLVGVYHSEVLNQVGLFLLMGLGLNIVVGFAGMLDLGYVAFFAIGAYTIGVLTSPESFLYAGTGRQPWTYWEALPIAILIGVFSGILLGIPVLRMRGDYLAIVTLGFGEIIRLLALSTWLEPYLGGAQGISDIPPIVVPWIAVGARCGPVGLPVCIVPVPIAGPNKPQMLFYLIMAAVLLAAYIAIRLKDSRFGRAWMAMREDEDVAEAMGVHLVSTKLLAFAAGAALSALSGTLFAEKLGSIYPHSFSLLISIFVLAVIIVGGMGSIPGVIVGALVLIGLPELLREFAEYRLMVYGALLVLMMLKRPEGLIPNTVVRREMHERDAPSSPGVPG